MRCECLCGQSDMVLSEHHLERFDLVSLHKILHLTSFTARCLQLQSQLGDN